VTVYIVLREAGEGAWRIAGDADSDTPAEAIRAVHGGEPASDGFFVAISKNRWKPALLTTRTVATVDLAPVEEPPVEEPVDAAS
jgi:hypothetical protein